MASIDIVRVDGTPRETDHGVRSDTSSRGVDLEGAQITATYADGTSETLTWKALDPYTTGGASGTDINMFFGYSWHELTTTKTLASLSIDLSPANSVFDTTTAMGDDPGDPSTPGSLNGFPFKLGPDYEDTAGEITATYSGIVNLSGSAPVGDLYTTLTIDFSGLPGGGLLGRLDWNSDIDTMTGPFKDVLDAVDDVLTISGDGSEQLNILDNDQHGDGTDLKITQINGQAIAPGGSVTLPSGEVVTLNADGTLSITNDSPLDETNSFSYTLDDGEGQTDIGWVKVSTKVKVPPCFVAGARIRTLKGDVAVEDLQIGDLVITRDHGPQPLRWIGRCRRRAEGKNAPVAFAADAIGEHGPISVSPNHRVLLRSEMAELLCGQREVLVKAKHLLNDQTIRIDAHGGVITYVHLLFDQHEIVTCDGFPSESYHPGAETLDSFDAQTRAEVLELMAEIEDYGPTARLEIKAHESRLLSQTR